MGVGGCSVGEEEGMHAVELMDYTHQCVFALNAVVAEPVFFDNEGMRSVCGLCGHA